MFKFENESDDSVKITFESDNFQEFFANYKNEYNLQDFSKSVTDNSERRLLCYHMLHNAYNESNASQDENLQLTLEIPYKLSFPEDFFENNAHLIPGGMTINIDKQYYDTITIEGKGKVNPGYQDTYDKIIEMSNNIADHEIVEATDGTSIFIDYKQTEINLDSYLLSAHSEATLNELEQLKEKLFIATSGFHYYCDDVKKGKYNDMSMELGSNFSYLHFQSQNFSKRSGPSQFFSNHGNKGKMNAIEFLDAVNNATTEKEVYTAVIEALNKSSDDEHSLSRYILHSLSEGLNAVEVKDFNASDIAKMKKSEFKDLKNTKIQDFSNNIFSPITPS